MGNIFGIGKPDESFQNNDTIDRYQNRPGANYSATGGPITTPQEILNNVWQSHLASLQRTRGPMDANEIERERRAYFNDWQRQENARQLAAQKNVQEIATGRRNELDQARQQNQFDTGIASRGMLLDAAMGQAPSQAQMLMQRRGGEVARNAMSMARSAREYNPALMSQAMNQGALAGIELGGMAGEMRAREMADARNALLNADQSSLSARAQQAQLQQAAMNALRDEYLKRDDMQQAKDARAFSADFGRDQYNVGVQNAANNASHGSLWNATNAIGNLAANGGSLMSGGLGGGKK